VKNPARRAASLNHVHPLIPKIKAACSISRSVVDNVVPLLEAAGGRNNSNYRLVHTHMGEIVL